MDNGRMFEKAAMKKKNNQKNAKNRTDDESDNPLEKT
jgi:hypothetical protein